MIPPFRLPRFAFTKITLPNGLDVIVRQQKQLPIVAVNLWYHVGSKNEERTQRGFAHLFEHLMFEGSEHYPGDFFKPLQRLGASINGSTSPDRTNYFVDIPSAHVEVAVAMESDRMGHLLSALSDEKLRIQKDVVKNEYRQNYANRPYGMAWQLLAEAVYPPGHPYSWLTIGSMDDVGAATRQDVEAFFQRFYVPSNASLCLVGDIEEELALELAARYFGPIPSGAAAAPVWALDQHHADDVELVYRDRVELERIYQVWRSVAHFEPDDAPLALLADILARGKSSRLYRKLVVEKELAQDVGAYQAARELAGTFGLHVTLRPGRSRQEARDIVDGELRAIAEGTIAETELDRVKNGRLAGFVFALDNVGGFGGVADRLNAYNVYLGDPRRITSDFERYQGVELVDVQRAARSIVGKPRVTLTVLSSKQTTSVAPLDRSVRPASAEPVPFRPPAPEIRQLGCGVPLWVIPRRDLPIAALTIVLEGGGARASSDQAGVAQLAAAMMDEGTATRSSQQLALEAEGMGTSLTTSCGWDGSYVSIQCLSPHLAASLDLAVDVLRAPSFPESEWRRIQGQTLAALRAERDSAEALAYRAFLAAVFPAGHSYRLPLDGTEQSVAELTCDDLRRFHERHHGAHGAACVIAGDVDADEAAAWLDERLSDWAGPAAEPAGVVEVQRMRRPRIVLVNRPGAAQAVVRAGYVGIARLDADYTPALVLNQILGGQFSSRLNAKLREEKGFTYGIRSHFDCRRAAGPFSITASIQTERVAEAINDIRAEMTALLDDRPPTLSELEDARRALIEGQARHFENPAALVSRYANLFVHGLPPDHHAHFAERLRAVTPELLADVAGRVLLPDALVVVVAGDAELLGDSLGRVDWADLEVLGE